MGAFDCRRGGIVGGALITKFEFGKVLIVSVLTDLTLGGFRLLFFF